MVRQLQEQGLVISELEVKLFGGSDMMMASLANHQRVGKSNVKMAKTVLARMGMTIKSSDTGGTVGRKLIFNTGTGDVWIKRLNQGR
jgi:chemotaxis protein CheD